MNKCQMIGYAAYHKIDNYITDVNIFIDSKKNQENNNNKNNNKNPDLHQNPTRSVNMKQK